MPINLLFLKQFSGKIYLKQLNRFKKIKQYYEPSKVYNTYNSYGSFLQNSNAPLTKNERIKAINKFLDSTR